MRGLLTLVVLLGALAVPASADTVECPGGKRFVGDPLDAPCTQACPNGGWDLLGGDCRPERERRTIRPAPPRRAARAPELVLVYTDPLRSRCERIWPDDLARREQCERELLAQLVRIPHDAPGGFADPFEQEIFLFCLDESFFPGEGRPDFASAARCVSAQKDALRTLERMQRMTDGHFD
jgi:hypothetical protein